MDLTLEIQPQSFKWISSSEVYFDSTHLNGKAGGRSDFREVRAEGLDDSSPPDPEPGRDAKAAVEEYREGRLRGLFGRTLRVNGPEGDQGTYGVADVVSAVGEAAEGGRQHLEKREQLGYVGVLRVGAGLGSAVTVGLSDVQQRTGACVCADFSLWYLQLVWSVKKSTCMINFFEEVLINDFPRAQSTIVHANLMIRLKLWLHKWM